MPFGVYNNVCDYNYKPMIEYVKGELAELSPTYAVVDVNGVGYGLHITLNTYSAVQGKANARLWVHENIREDAYLLFGFATKQEREAFLLLITVSGIGANTARMILSELTAAELCNVIMTDNVRALTSVKGIGQRTAQRLILELKDKIVALGVEPEQVAASSTAAPDPVH